MGESIIIVCGLLGTGNTTISKYLECGLGYTRFNTDEVRKFLGKKIFDLGDTPRVNDFMYEKARILLENKKGVIFDSAYKTKLARQKIYEFGKYYGIPLLVIECICSPEVAKKRIMYRIKGSDLHEATNKAEVYDEYAKIFEHIDGDLNDHRASFVSFITLDTEKLKKIDLRIESNCRDIVHKVIDLLFEGGYLKRLSKIRKNATIDF